MLPPTKRRVVAECFVIYDFETFIFTADLFTRYGHVLQTSLISGLMGFICSCFVVLDEMHLKVSS